MEAYRNKDLVTITIDDYQDAIVAKKFLEYVLLVEEDITYDNLVGKFATPTESKYSLYRIASIRKGIRLVQAFISKKETAHGAKIMPTKIDILMNTESYNRFVKEFIHTVTSMIATI